MPEYLVRLVQMHESFRKAELQALAELAGVEMDIVKYEEDSPFCILTLPSPAAAKALISRSILSLGIYSLWGHGTSYDLLHASTSQLSSHQWPAFQSTPFRFTVDSFRGTKTAMQQREIIESFSYMNFRGPIKMRDAAAEVFTVFEDYKEHAAELRYLYFGRLVGSSSRHLKTTYDLKKRHYISTTSMDAELALLTANMALAAPGKLFYDPFMGTGGFPIASAEFGAYAWGSDIDGRSIRGTGGSARKGQIGKRDVQGNFKQYGLEGRYLGGFVSDLTNTPLRIQSLQEDGSAVQGRSIGRGWLDGIICDPPYGVREGLKVLGSRAELSDLERSTHRDRYMESGYIPPKRPYSFTALLDDILAFAAETLVEGGRLSMWVPTANDEDVELVIPVNPRLRIMSVCVQRFNKWSRRLLTYRRLAEEEVLEEQGARDEGVMDEKGRENEVGRGAGANELNDFRRKYFEGFKEFERLRRDGSSPRPDGALVADQKGGWDSALRDVFGKGSST
ncbi:tRNA guanosine-2'-O-methyltransferase [Lindgomyces ingoldianus]|uniref:tRNA guanosine-2'-O-methyltransferase n=1 Tax=Lindgomyces ingoldianus TaxID=673940 RepID=A0ACB6Q859_9PLEO|nr:tRNA guanosine-2'-O-methyltransferase [Lindgomyces ingoldianus]KAF2463138.1 tRNA guanosine-2'-O-methyltransferase [Lindgomyces ingoldianus]